MQLVPIFPYQKLLFRSLSLPPYLFPRKIVLQTFCRLPYAFIFSSKFLSFLDLKDPSHQTPPYFFLSPVAIFNPPLGLPGHLEAPSAECSSSVSMFFPTGNHRCHYSPAMSLFSPSQVPSSLQNSFRHLIPYTVGQILSFFPLPRFLHFACFSFPLPPCPPLLVSSFLRSLFFDPPLPPIS